MKKHFRKGIALLCSAVLATSLFAGCSSGSSSAAAPGSSSSASASVSNSESGPLFSEPVTLSMLTPSHASWPFQEDWYVVDLIKEYTNVDLKVTAVDTSGFSEKLNLTMASGELPDLMFLTDNTTVQQYAPQGAFINILDHLDKMPNFKAWYEENQQYAANYLSADGGLYAELIQNRDFEYDPSDREGDKNWNSTHSWKLEGENATFTISTSDPIHPNNPHYAVLKTNQPGAALTNTGFDGIALKAGEKYDFSLFARIPEGSKSGKLLVRLVDADGTVQGETTVTVSSRSWKTYKAVLTAKTSADTRLELRPQSAGEIELDMISLFPQNTFKGRKNGLRPDLAQTLADMHPRFVRFPGGCVAHGDGLKNIYQWKNTIGPLEARKPARNLWGYHQSMGLGYYEYFQFCEDIGAEPLPVLAAGVSCQNSSDRGHGQQGGIPMDKMPEYVQDVLDLIEWANGDAKTTKWGKLRAEQGHPAPFNLKYIGIGNEDLISKTFEERYLMIVKAVKEKYPDIVVCGTSGPWSEGSDYETGWRLAKDHKIDMIDEHYYQTPGWFIYHQDYYDQYDRNGSKVYLGEYAAHTPGRPNNIETALCEALHICGMERNGDVVAMSSYAPLLAKEHHTQWNPDMIYFNNKEVKPTVGYYVQKLCGNYCGDEYIESTLSVNEGRKGVRERLAVSTVRDSKTGKVYIKMVNLLNHPVKGKLDLSSLKDRFGEAQSLDARLHVLTGNWDDRNARPKESDIKVKPEFDYELPAYSFSLIEI